MKSCLKRKKTRGTRSETLLDTSAKERVELSSLDPMGDGQLPLRQQSHINLLSDTWSRRLRTLRESLELQLRSAPGC